MTIFMKSTLPYDYTQCHPPTLSGANSTCGVEITINNNSDLNICWKSEYVVLKVFKDSVEEASFEQTFTLASGGTDQIHSFDFTSLGSGSYEIKLLHDSVEIDSYSAGSLCGGGGGMLMGGGSGSSTFTGNKFTGNGGNNLDLTGTTFVEMT